MKGYLYRAILKKYWKLLLSMLLVSAFGCATMTGINSGCLSLQKTLDAYMQKGGYPDAVITTDVVKRSKMDALLALDVIEQVNTRLVGDGIMISPEGRYLSIRMMSFDEDDFQKIYFWERAEANGLYPIYLEYFFAQNNGIRAGDTVTLMSGDESRTYLVAGIISRPETLATEVSEEISVNSDDFGYAYAHRALLEIEVNQEYRDGVREWEQKSGELAEAEQTARQDYENALEQLREAEAELQKNETEFSEKRIEMQEQLSELAQKRDELKAARKELAQNHAEAILNQANLSRKKAEAETKQAELRQARKELDESRAQLAETEKEMLEQLKPLTEQQAEIRSQFAVLDETEQELTAGKEELEKVREETLKTQRQLKLGQVELNKKRADAVTALSALRQAKTILSQLGQSVSIAQVESTVGRQLNGALENLSGQLDDQEPLQNLLKQNADELRAQLNALLGAAGMSGSVSESALDAAIAQAESGIAQIDNGIWTIVLALREIETGLEEADKKEAEINDALEQVQEAKNALQDLLAQMDDGLGQMKDGFGEIADGYAEMDDYQARISGGLSELEEGFSQIAEYQKQLDEVFLQIRDGEIEIENGFTQIEEAEQQIRDGIVKAEQNIAEGKIELSAKRVELENGWTEAQAEFANGEAELQKAADELAEWEGYHALCNQFLLRFSAGASLSAVLAQAQEILAMNDVTVQASFLFQDSPVKQRIDGNMIPMETMANFIPLFFFGITMIVVYLFMALMIRQCRREIGILRALGFTRFSVVRLFCGIGLIVSIGAVVLGFAISLGIRQYLCAYYFDLLFHLPMKDYVFNAQRFLVSAALTVVVVLLSTFISASSISSVQPSEAMTRPRPTAVSIPRSIQWALRRASPFSKFSIISLLRNKLRFVFSAFCLAGSVMLIFTSFSLISSSNEIIRQVFDRCIHYDSQVFVHPGMGEDLREKLAALPYVSDVEAMDYYSAEISFQGSVEKTMVAAAREQTALISVEDKQKKPLSLAGNGILLEEHLAEKLGVGVNDIVAVDSVALPVAAISRQNGSRVQYITLETAAALAKPSLQSLIFRISSEYENDLMQFLMEQDGVLYTSFTHSTYSAYETLLSGAKIVAVVLIAIAMAIGLVIVVNTSQTNLLEQKKELCVLRTLGFQHREVSRYWFFQSILHFLVSCVLGFPAGIELAKSTLRQLETASRSYPFSNSPMDYALTALSVLGYIVLSHFLTMRALKGWEIVEVVKEKE